MKPFFALNRRRATMALLLPLALLAGRNALAQDAQNVIEDARELSAFNALELRSSVDVVVVQSNRHHVTVVGKRDLVSKVTTEVRGDKLVVSTESGWSFNWRQEAGVRAIVEVVDLRSASISGSGNLSTKSLKGKTLAFSVSGSGDMRLAGLHADSLTVNVSGSGDVTASGKAATQRIAVAGSGDVRADQLEGAVVSVSIAGSGDVRVWSTQTLKASIAGSGDVRYRGKPEVTKSVVGSGDVAAL